MSLTNITTRKVLKTGNKRLCQSITLDYIYAMQYNLLEMPHSFTANVYLIAPFGNIQNPPCCLYKQLTGLCVADSLSSLRSRDSEGTMAPKDIMTNSHAKSILNAMNSLRKSNTLCDITLRVENTDFPAHRIVLAACSDYFCAMFTSEVTQSRIPLSSHAVVATAISSSLTLIATSCTLSPHPFILFRVLPLS